MSISGSAAWPKRLNEFGGQLGSTFNYIFEYQLEHLQNGDRFYYLSRTQGMNLLNLLEPNTFTDLVMRNTDLGDLHATHLPGVLMSVPDMTLELDNLAGQDNYSGNAVLRRHGSDRSQPARSHPRRSVPAGHRSQGRARSGYGASGCGHVLDADGQKILRRRNPEVLRRRACHARRYRRQRHPVSATRASTRSGATVATTI